MKEVWKDIKDYEGLYQVSNLGNVRSLDKILKAYIKNQKNIIRKGKKLKPRYDKKGYQMVVLYKNGIGKNFKVHRLVAEAFIPNPNNLPQINHKDETKRNNIFTNLEWCDCKYNNNYGNHKTFGNKKVIMLDKNNNKINIFDSVNEASKKTNIIATSIGKCCNKKQKTAGGYVWEYCREEDKLCN